MCPRISARLPAFGGRKANGIKGRSRPRRSKCAHGPQTQVWVKPTIGIGNYWRNSHEILLTAVRGNARSFNDHSLKSWLEAERDEHSGKPEEVRGFIERASPGPRLELFGRARPRMVQHRPRDVRGDDVPGGADALRQA